MLEHVIDNHYQPLSGSVHSYRLSPHPASHKTRLRELLEILPLNFDDTLTKRTFIRTTTEPQVQTWAEGRGVT
jgi:hypothetical protein